MGAAALLEGTSGRSSRAGSPRSGAALLITLSPRATLAGLPPGTRVTELSPALGDVIVTLPAADAREAGQLIAGLRHQPGVIAVQRNDAWHSAATGTECAPRPDSPVTYQAAAVNADKVTSPPSTSPIAQPVRQCIHIYQR